MKYNQKLYKIYRKNTSNFEDLKKYIQDYKK